MGEIRLPVKLMASSLSRKETKALWLLTGAKLEGHRSEIKPLLTRMKIHPKTGQRLIKRMVVNGWAGTDGKFLFPRAWHKLKLSKRGGLYLATAPQDQKVFDVLCFVKALKRILKRKRNPERPQKGRAQQARDFSTKYLCKAMQISERRFKRLKTAAQKQRLIAVTYPVSVVGSAKDFSALRLNIHGPPLFVRGGHTVVPEVSQITVLL